MATNDPNARDIALMVNVIESDLTLKNEWVSLLRDKLVHTKRQLIELVEEAK